MPEYNVSRRQNTQLVIIGRAGFVSCSSSKLENNRRDDNRTEIISSSMSFQWRSLALDVAHTHFHQIRSDCFSPLAMHMARYEKPVPYR